MATEIIKNRKIRKPLMEKKRRERINNSLETLKHILVEDKTILLKRTDQKLVRYEKADILELTVQYVQAMHSKWSVLSDSDSDKVSSKSSSANIKIKNCNNKENINKPIKTFKKKSENQKKIQITTEKKRHWRPW